MKGYGTGLLSNQGEKSINFLFHKGSFKKKVLKYGTPSPGDNDLLATPLSPGPDSGGFGHEAEAEGSRVRVEAT